MSEGLQWSFVKYQDNQSCLDLIEGSPVSVISLLTEVSCSFSHCSVICITMYFVILNCALLEPHF